MNLGSLADIAKPIAGAAITALMLTLLGAFLTTIATAGGAYAIASNGSTLRGLLAVLVAVLAGVVVGWIVALKSAVLSGLRAGVEKAGLGRRLCDRVFQRLSGTPIAAYAERVPLAQAEQYLHGVLGASRREDLAGQGFLARKAGERALDMVAKVTLAQFREEGAATGGVNLPRAQQMIGGMIDGYVSRTIGKKVLMLVFLLGGLTVVGTLAIAFGIRQLSF